MSEPTPNAIDLSTLDAVKQWVGSVNSAGMPVENDAWDPVIQNAITAFSLYLLRATGRSPQNGLTPDESSLNAQVAVTEVYDGSGSDRQFLRLWPIRSVQSLAVGPRSIGASSGWGNPGYVIDGSGKSISIVGGGGNNGYATFSDLRGRWGDRNRGAFWSGIQNVTVAYTAGFDGTPFDLLQLVTEAVALNYKRRDWIGQLSQAMANGAGSVSFSQKALADNVKEMIQYYRRRAAV